MKQNEDFMLKPKFRKGEISIPNFWGDAIATEDSYCGGCVEEKVAKILRKEGVPMELCDECCEDLRAERKRDERGEK